MSNRALYIILEIQPDATPEEIKRAYHRLALQYHPDRAGPESAEKFQQILAAYTLLKDPEAREVYDRYGEQGLSNMEAMPAMAEAAQHMDKVSFFRLMFGMGTFLSANATALCGTMGAKLDNPTTKMSFQTAFIPGYTLLLFAVLAVAIGIYFRVRKYRQLYQKHYTQQCDETADAENDAPPAADNNNLSIRDFLRSVSMPTLLRELQFWNGQFLIISVCLSLLLMCVTFGLKEQGTKSKINLWFVYTPAIVGNVLSFVSVPVLRSTLRLRGVHDISTYLLVFLNVINVSLAALRTIQIILVVSVFESNLHLTAEAWTVPAELYFTLMFVSETTVTVQRTRALRKMEKEAAYMSSEEGETAARNRGKSRAMWAEVGFWFYVNVLVVFGLIFSARADAVGGYTRAYIPLFILFGSLFLGCLFMFTCFTIFIEAEAIEKREREKEEVVELERQRTDEQRENGDNYDAVVNCYDDRPYTPTATS